MAFQRKPRALSAPPLTPDEALAKLEHFCAFRERCPQEVQQKIKELRLSADLGEQLYHLLEQEKFFNERRFTESFVRGKLRGNHWGRVRIRMELRQRAIAADLIEQVLEQEVNEDDYLALLHDLLARKRRQYGPDDPNARQKSAASLIRAGFEPNLVFGALGQTFATEDLENF